MSPALKFFFLIGLILGARDHSNVATGVKYGVALPLSWSNSNVILEWAS